MLCSCPKLTPLQTRLLASVSTLLLLGLIYWTLSHPYFAYASELEFDGRGESRIAGKDHNWHRIAHEALENDGVEVNDGGFAVEDATRVLDVRAPVVSSVGGNNVANNDNIKAGQTSVWMFSAEQLRSQPGEKGPGLPGSVTATEESDMDHFELRKKDLEGEEGIEKRQNGREKRIYISVNTCLQPNYIGPGVQEKAPPQLSLYVSETSSNQNPGPSSNGRQQKVDFNEGFASATVMALDDWYMSVHAPNLPDNFDGVWNYELAVSIDEYFHAHDSMTSNLFLLDSDSSAALMTTDNLTQADKGTSLYNEWMNLEAPFIVFASNTNDTRTMGLRNSFCGLNKNSQIVGNQDQADGDGTNVQMQMTTRGLGNKPKEQFYITSLNASSTYIASLAQVGNSTNSGSGVVRGGGIVWSSTTFPTKTDGNCALLFNLDFCSEVAYAVPSNPDLVADYSRFQALYDNSTLQSYQNFNYSLQQIPCHTVSEAQYSLARTCDDCAKAYKDWLCAVSIPRCADFSSSALYLQQRNMGQPFLNGSMLPSSLLHAPYTPMSKAPTLEGTTAYSQTHFTSRATNFSRNPLIDDEIRPGPYKEVLPCADLCYGLVQSCPAALGFGCPYPGKGLEMSYGNRHGNGNGTLSCSFLGAYVYTGGVGRVAVSGLKGIGVAVVVAMLVVVGL